VFLGPCAIKCGSGIFDDLISILESLRSFHGSPGAAALSHSQCNGRRRTRHAEFFFDKRKPASKPSDQRQGIERRSKRVPGNNDTMKSTRAMPRLRDIITGYLQHRAAPAPKSIGYIEQQATGRRLEFDFFRSWIRGSSRNQELFGYGCG
jgi:hypothetical protein